MSERHSMPGEAEARAWVDEHVAPPSRHLAHTLVSSLPRVRAEDGMVSLADLERWLVDGQWFRRDSPFFDALRREFGEARDA